MTTDKKPMSGKYRNEGQIDKLDKYNKDSKSKAVGRFMRTFARTKTSQLVTAWDDTNYLQILIQGPNFIGDTTGNVDSATPGATPLLALLDIAWELYYTNANLKDLVAAEEASWKLYFCAYLQIVCSLQIQYNFRTLLPAFTESDTVPGDATHLPYWTQSSFDIFCASMSDFPAPKGVYEICKTFFSWIVLLAPSYEQYTLRLPETFMVPFIDLYDLADMEALRTLLRVNLGNFITHSKKFGLGVGKWSDPVKPTIKDTSDPDVIAFFNHNYICFYDNTPGNDFMKPLGGFPGVNLLTDYTNTIYFFKDNPNESPMHVLAPWFGMYEATNNTYGGLFTRATNLAEYAVNIATVSQHGTAITWCNWSSAGTHIVVTLHKAFHDNRDATFARYINGTNFTAQQAMPVVWPLAATNRLLSGTGRGAEETKNDLINYIGRLIT